MSSPNLSSKTIQLKANERRMVAVSGQFFMCQFSSAPFRISIDGGEQIDMNQGFSFPTEEPFRNIFFVNLNNFAVTITFYTGSKQIVFSSQSQTFLIKNAPTYVKANGNQLVNPGASLVFNGLDGTNVRKQIILSNSNADPDNFYLVLDDSNQQGLFIQPGESKTFETSGSLTVKNPQSGAILIMVMEIFYS